MHYNLSIYGDNIIECERTYELIKTGIKENEKLIIEKLNNGNLVVPEYFIEGKKNTFIIKLYSGQNNNRWNINIYEQLVTGNGGSLKEGVDAILTVKTGDNNIKEVPVFAIEFSSALPAGNNSWQRSGRAYSFSQAKIPFVYSTEIGGNELDYSGNVIATRWPSSAVILSYILNSERKDIINLMHYKFSPVASKDIKQQFSFLEENKALENLVYSCITNMDLTASRQEMLEMGKKVYKEIANDEENYYTINKTFDATCFMKGVKKNKLPWKKKFSIQTSDSFPVLMDTLTELCFSPYASSSIPIAILPNENIEQFISSIKTIYNKSEKSDVVKFLRGQSSTDIAFAVINGFKPRGDDSRPDRGVLPLARMLAGDVIPIITIIFGPVPQSHLNKINNNELEDLSERNGLFGAILSGTDFLIIDSVNAGGKDALFAKNTIKQQELIHPNIDIHLKGEFNSLPKKIGEHDVDTVIHMIFKHGISDAFVSFSNPPGGDWSGISILQEDHEYRWISLPRAPKNVKRPDQIFQLNNNVLLCIESKEKYTDLINHEKNVGPQMIAYLDELLFVRKANAIRRIGTEDFQLYSERVNTENFEYLTGVTFSVTNQKNLENEQMRKLIETTETDVAIGIEIKKNKEIIINYYTNNRTIKEILDPKNIKLLESKKNIRIKVIE